MYDFVLLLCLLLSLVRFYQYLPLMYKSLFECKMNWLIYLQAQKTYSEKVQQQ